MNEYLRIGAAILAGIAVFAIIFKRTGGDCVP
jgi:hypothetical protein